MPARTLMLALRMVLSASLVMTACNDAEDPVSSDAGGADANEASAGDAATDATSSTTHASANADASTSTTVRPTPGPVICGGRTCTAPQGGMLPNIACCLPDKSCGAMPDLSSFAMGGGGGFPSMSGGGGAGLDGTCLDVSAGTPDPSCPSQSVMGIALNGCCSKAGTCGLDLSIGGLGCNAISGLGALASFVGGGAMDAGPPQKCSGASRDGGVDSGADGGADAGPDAGADASVDASAPSGDASSAIDGSSSGG